MKSINYKDKNHPQLTREFVEKAVKEYLKKGKIISVIKNNYPYYNIENDYDDRSDYLYTGHILPR